MKTTLNIDDELLRRAKEAAAARGITLTSFVEDAIRDALDAKPADYELCWQTTPGRSAPAVDPADREGLYELMDRQR